MNNRYFLSIASLLIISSAVLLINSCGVDSDVTAPPMNYMAGTITFTDTDFMSDSMGLYSVSFYDKNTNTIKLSDSLVINISNGVATSHFKCYGLAAASYYVTCTWKNRSLGVSTILGMYGCEVPPTCSYPVPVEYPDEDGTDALNFKSKTK
jgi:hypothetical protein